MWNDAKKHCQIIGKELRLNGDLAAVLDEETQSFLTSFGFQGYFEVLQSLPPKKRFKPISEILALGRVFLVA